MPLNNKQLENSLTIQGKVIDDLQSQVDNLREQIKFLATESTRKSQPPTVVLPPPADINIRREMRAMFFTLLPFAILAALGSVVLVLQVATVLSRIVLRG